MNKIKNFIIINIVLLGFATWAMGGIKSPGALVKLKNFQGTETILNGHIGIVLEVRHDKQHKVSVHLEDHLETYNDICVENLEFLDSKDDQWLKAQELIFDWKYSPSQQNTVFASTLGIVFTDGKDSRAQFLGAKRSPGLFFWLL